MAETWKKLAFEEDVVTKALLDAQSVLTAVSDDTPVALVLAEQEVVGRLTGGDVDGIALGIADNNIVQIDDADAADDDYAKFTAAGLEGRSFAEVLADLSGQAGAAFDFNAQDVTVADLIIADGGLIGSASDLDAISIAAGGEVTLSQTLILSDVVNAGADVDKFLVLDGTGNVDFRTGTEALADMGGLSGGVDTSGTPAANDFARFTDVDTIEGLSYAETLAALSGGAGAAFDWNGQQLENMVLHTVADDAAKTALTQVLAMIVWQTDDACAYICTSVA